MSESMTTPNKWNLLRLDEVFQIARGGSPRPIIDYITEEDGYNWIKIGDTKNIDKYIYKTKQKIRKEGLKKSLLVKEDDFILSNSMSFGKPYIMKTEGCIHDGWLLLRKLKKDISVDFMYYVLSSDFIKTQFISKAAGSTVQNLNIKLVETVKALIPPLPEQQKIAKILSTVDDKIEVIDKQIIETQELKKGLMQRLLTKGIGHTEFKDSPLGEIPMSWDVVKLGNLVSKVGSGITPKGGREAYLEEGVTFIRSQNVLRGSLKLIDVAFISQNQHNKMGNSKLQPEDVLLNITGASIGRSCVIPMDFKEGNVNQHVCIIRTNTELNSNFLSHHLNSSFGMNQIDKFQAGGNREGLNFQQIRSFDIPLPPLEEQEKIGGLLVLIEDKIDVLSEKKTHYQELKQGLMQQLLTGKIRVKV